MMSDEEIAIAREKGRLGAEEIYRRDPEKRAQAEAIFGVEYMRYTYPRAYQKPKGFIDRMLYWGQ